MGPDQDPICLTLRCENFIKQEMFHNVTNAPKDTFFLELRPEVKVTGHSDPMAVCDTQWPQGVSTHQILEICSRHDFSFLRDFEVKETDSLSSDGHCLLSHSLMLDASPFQLKNDKALEIKMLSRSNPYYEIGMCFFWPLVGSHLIIFKHQAIERSR